MECHLNVCSKDLEQITYNERYHTYPRIGFGALYKLHAIKGAIHGQGNAPNLGVSTGEIDAPDHANRGLGQLRRLVFLAH